VCLNKCAYGDINVRIYVIFAQNCAIFLMNHRKERVRATQSADVEKRGNDEVALSGWARKQS